MYKNADINKKANVYHDGRVTSRSITTAEGESKTLGIMLPGSYNFGTGAPEVMEITAGRCRVRLQGENDWQEYAAGESFEVPGNSRFDIEVTELLDYVCHFG
ncbi:MAG TPA: pyrimidine/purine nucleoside phosphorylase [Mariprofundaceae bacterium]|nr:pyrimidine/purine nucleoside phosphorylase [Mariprofundaceae bacterium]